jgi:hypothetical protein
MLHVTHNLIHNTHNIIHKYWQLTPCPALYCITCYCHVYTDLISPVSTMHQLTTPDVHVHTFHIHVVPGKAPLHNIIHHHHHGSAAMSVH